MRAWPIPDRHLVAATRRQVAGGCCPAEPRDLGGVASALQLLAGGAAPETDGVVVAARCDPHGVRAGGEADEPTFVLEEPR